MVTYANNYDSYTCIVAGKIVPFETGVGEGYFVSRPVDQRPKGRNLPSLTDRVGRHKSGYRRRVRRIICCFDEPSGDIGERLPAVRAMCKKRLQVRFLLSSEEHTSELQSLMRISYAVFCSN